MLASDEKFDGSNWVEWKGTITSAAESRGLDGYLEGTITKPAALVGVRASRLESAAYVIVLFWACAARVVARPLVSLVTFCFCALTLLLRTCI